MCRSEFYRMTTSNSWMDPRETQDGERERERGEQERKTDCPWTCNIDIVNPSLHSWHRIKHERLLGQQNGIRRSPGKFLREKYSRWEWNKYGRREGAKRHSRAFGRKRPGERAFLLDIGKKDRLGQGGPPSQSQLSNQLSIPREYTGRLAAVIVALNICRYSISSAST